MTVSPNEGTEPTDEPTGEDSPPAPESGADEATKALIEKLKGENEQHRKERRQLKAENLVLRYKLPKSQTDLLALLPHDQQEEKAKAIAAELTAQAPAATTSPTEGETKPAEEPPKQLDDATTNGLKGLNDAGGQPPNVGTQIDDLRKAISKAESEGDIKQSLSLKNLLLAKQKEAGKV